MKGKGRIDDRIVADDDTLFLPSSSVKSACSLPSFLRLDAIAFCVVRVEPEEASKQGKRATARHFRLTMWPFSDDDDDNQTR